MSLTFKFTGHTPDAYGDGVWPRAKIEGEAIEEEENSKNRSTRNSPFIVAVTWIFCHVSAANQLRGLPRTDTAMFINQWNTTSQGYRTDIIITRSFLAWSFALLHKEIRRSGPSRFVSEMVTLSLQLWNNGLHVFPHQTFLFQPSLKYCSNMGHRKDTEYHEVNISGNRRPATASQSRQTTRLKRNPGQPLK